MEQEQVLLRLGFIRLKPEAAGLFYQHYEQLDGDLAAFTSFVSMVAWSHSDIVFYRTVRDFLVCVAWEYTGQRFVLLPFFGKYSQAEINAVFKEAEEVFKELKAPLVMTDIREWMIPWYQKIPGVKWELVNDRDYSDYMYRKEDFLAAADTQKNRYNYRYFIRKFEPETVELTAESEGECLSLLEETWCEVHTCDECDCGCQKQTISNVLSSLDQTGAKGILVSVKGQPVGYSIVEARRGVGIFHFMKIRKGYRGINEYIHRECCERYFRDCDMINYTEDMGEEGLRLHKSRLAPYTLAPNCELRMRYASQEEE